MRLGTRDTLAVGQVGALLEKRLIEEVTTPFISLSLALPNLDRSLPHLAHLEEEEDEEDLYWAGRKVAVRNAAFLYCSL